MSVATRRQFLLASTGAVALVAPVAAQSLAEEQPDAELIALGRLFDLGFSAFCPACRTARKLDAEFLKRNKDPKTGKLLDGWEERHDLEVEPFSDVVNDMVDYLDVITSRIRELPASTFQGLAVKANALRFDLAMWCDNTAPREDWNHEDECLAIFIDEAKRLAAQERVPT